MGDEYQPRTPARLIEILRAQDDNPRSWEVEAAETIERLVWLLSRPYIGAWVDEIMVEAAHQRERWGAKHDVGKNPQDWFWLGGYLGGKALHAHITGDLALARHHTVSAGAVLAHWAAQISGDENVMRPGVGADKIMGL
jgi:hypothetical protein